MGATWFKAPGSPFSPLDSAVALVLDSSSLIEKNERRSQTISRSFSTGLLSVQRYLLGLNSELLGTVGEWDSLNLFVFS